MPLDDPRNDAIAIEVDGLTKSFGGKVVVRDLSMRVRRGQIYGFLGPNGSGKTTTLRMLCGLLTPDSGRGTALGYDIRTESEEIKRHVGYMTQRFSLYQDLSILENLEFVARVYGLDDPGREARVYRAVEALVCAGFCVFPAVEIALLVWRRSPVCSRAPHAAQQWAHCRQSEQGAQDLGWRAECNVGRCKVR
jgi:ABC-type transport system involved in cytochrome c biogenesis ATPase subunit